MRQKSKDYLDLLELVKRFSNRLMLIFLIDPCSPELRKDIDAGKLDAVCLDFKQLQKRTIDG